MRFSTAPRISVVRTGTRDYGWCPDRVNANEHAEWTRACLLARAERRMAEQARAFFDGLQTAWTTRMSLER